MKISLLEKELKKPKLSKSQVDKITKKLDEDPDLFGIIEKVLSDNGLTMSDYYRSKIFYNKQASVKSLVSDPPESESEPKSEPKSEPEPEPGSKPKSKPTIPGPGSEMKIMKFLASRKRFGEDVLWMQVAGDLTKKQQGCAFKHLMLDYKLVKIDKESVQLDDESVQLDEWSLFGSGAKTAGQQALKGFIKTLTTTNKAMLRGLEKASIPTIVKNVEFKPLFDFIKLKDPTIPAEHIAKFIQSSFNTGKLTGLKSRGQIVKHWNSWIKANPVSAEAHGTAALIPGANKGLKTAADIGGKKAAQLKKLEPGMWHNVMMKASQGAKQAGKKVLKKSKEEMLKHKKRLFAATAGAGAFAVWYNAEIPCDFDEIRKIMAKHDIEMRPM